METDVSTPGDDIVKGPQRATLGFQQPQQGIADEEAELELLRPFVEETCIPPSLVGGDRQQMLRFRSTKMGKDA